MLYTDIIGQSGTVAQLRAFGNLYAGGRTVPDNVLIVGDDGMGKRTIAAAFANENGIPILELDGASVRAKGDLTAILTNLQERQVLALSNIHRLPSPFQELLWGLARDGKLEIVIGQGPSTRRHTLELRPFTLIATAPRKSDCSPELLSIFFPYSAADSVLGGRAAAHIRKSRGPDWLEN